MKVNRDILAQCDACYLSVKENGTFAMKLFGEVHSTEVFLLSSHTKLQ